MSPFSLSSFVELDNPSGVTSHFKVLQTHSNVRMRESEASLLTLCWPSPDSIAVGQRGETKS